MISRRTLIGGGAGLVLGGLAIPLFLGPGPNNGQTPEALGPMCTPTGKGLRVEAVEHREWVPALQAAALMAGIPAQFLAAQIEAESGWNPDAVSSAGARGLTQFMPGTWDQYGNGADPFDPVAGIQAQGRYLHDLQEAIAGITGEDPQRLVFAAYNAGPGTVLKYSGIPPFRETQSYVSKIFDLAQRVYSADCAGSGPLELRPGEGSWVHPLPHSRITSGYGHRPCPAGATCNQWTTFHYGLDFSTGRGRATGRGATVIAPTPLRITLVQELAGGYGSRIMARCLLEPGYIFDFHHFAVGSMLVRQQQEIEAGTPLGIEGSTGNSTAAHLHFQVIKPDSNDQRMIHADTIDPTPILVEKGIL
ncbi:transglycosylase SLT domain-containing protein [Paeniglutamicibacter gangotriensis]|uniref:Lytic transglycosylase n=1 Tax=Paeniglutamicibacter gangotriensis Lz1y TaxID=1276920 RepID=M7MPF8_9MICC|nr:transglycosylase SLT domain-containing protein [Paeniglutamicibacter gangotriensis]EMQ96815.1 lytic transglycosylase [Paeniglutamicibacter gangotriensis Lz1y]